MCICMYAIRGYVWRWLRLLEAAALDTSFTICSTSTAASHVVHRMHQLRGSHCLANAATQLCALEMSVAKVHTGVLKVCKITTASSYCVAHVVGPCATMPVFRNNANPPQQLDVPARARCHRCRFCARATRASVVPLPVLAGAGRQVVRRRSGDCAGASCSVRTSTSAVCGGLVVERIPSHRASGVCRQIYNTVWQALVCKAYRLFFRSVLVSSFYYLRM